MYEIKAKVGYPNPAYANVNYVRADYAGSGHTKASYVKAGYCIMPYPPETGSKKIGHFGGK